MTSKSNRISYSALSKCYEHFIKYCDYEKWSQYLLDILKDKGLRKGIDLGCGSGYFTRVFCRNGYEVVGIDISNEMLNVAKELSVKENLDILYLKEDMKNFKFFGKVDFITAINDGINYLSDEDVLKCFKTAIKTLNTNGYFIFDISSEYKLKNVIGNNLFAEDDEEASYIWFNRLEGDKVIMDLSVFTKKGELYEKNEETQTQYIHTLPRLEYLLKSVGFTSVITSGLYGEKIKKDTDRIVFIAKK